jgi:hypothetical protein
MKSRMRKRRVRNKGVRREGKVDIKKRRREGYAEQEIKER